MHSFIFHITINFMAKFFPVKTSGYPKVYCFNTFFYEKLSKHETKWIARWTKKVHVLINL